jgi:enoyl-CoA hydratase
VPEDILVTEVTDRVAVVTLNRPEARNALSRELLDALPVAITACDENDAVDVVVLTGADPAFCAGLDLRGLGGGEIGAGAAGATLGIDDVTQEPMPSISKPIIAAVNGAAVTGGLEVVLACDFVVASERARFADTHARVGVMPGWGLTVRLAEAVGQRRAREMSVTGNFVDAPTALAWGLVNHVVPHDELLPFSRALAADIVSNDQSGVREVLETYKLETAVTATELRTLETRRSREWAGRGGGSADEIARRQSEVMARGRAQKEQAT